jgi:hypothetical protein
VTDKQPLPRWALPQWMEPYLPYLSDGGERVVELMNGSATTFSNAPLALVQSGYKGEVALLARLHDAGLLAPAPVQEQADLA